VGVARREVPEVGRGMAEADDRFLLTWYGVEFMVEEDQGKIMWVL
jgi:hypothetical protein